MVDREQAEGGYRPETTQRELPQIVNGFEGIKFMLRFISLERNILDLNLVIQSLSSSGRATLKAALWEVVETVSVEGVVPKITQVDRYGNPIA